MVLFLYGFDKWIVGYDMIKFPRETAPREAGALAAVLGDESADVVQYRAHTAHML